MEIYYSIFLNIVSILKMEFEIFGYTFSLWNVFCFTYVSSVMGWVVGQVILGD